MCSNEKLLLNSIKSTALNRYPLHVSSFLHLFVHVPCSNYANEVLRTKYIPHGVIRKQRNCSFRTAGQGSSSVNFLIDRKLTDEGKEFCGRLLMNFGHTICIT
ncbi:Protein SPIRAL1-like [Dirofilaria immitis]